MLAESQASTLQRDISLSAYRGGDGGAAFIAVDKSKLRTAAAATASAAALPGASSTGCKSPLAETVSIATVVAAWHTKHHVP
jgi:hypothetical protein